MQLGKPLPDSGGEDVIGGECVALLLLLALRGRQLVHRSFQEFQCPAPAIALVAHEALHQPDGVRRTVGVDADHFAIQRRGVAEAPFGQEPGDLAFRVHAGGHAPDHLHHHRVAHDQR